MGGNKKVKKMPSGMISRNVKLNSICQALDYIDCHKFVFQCITCASSCLELAIQVFGLLGSKLA